MKFKKDKLKFGFKELNKVFKIEDGEVY